MKQLVLTAALALSLAALAAAQGKDEWAESRFHRVHLRNGNFIDGQLLKQTAKDVMLQLKVGTISVRLDQIAKDENGDYKIVFMKLRSMNEEPKPTPLPGTGPATTPTTPKETKPTETKAPKKKRDPLVPKGTPQEQVNQIIAELGLVEPEDKYPVAVLLTKAGEGWAGLAAEKLGTLDDASVSIVASILANVKDAGVQKSAANFLRSEKAAVRTAALKIVGNGDASLAGQVRPLLSDSDSIVRGAALIAIKKLNDPDALDATIKLCMDPDAQIRKQAFDTATSIAGGNNLKPKLNEMYADALRGAKAELRAGFIQAIGQTADKDAWPVIAPYMNDDAPTARYEALIAAANIRTAESETAVLERFSQEKEKSVQVAVINSCRMMKLEKAGTHIIDWMVQSDDRDIDMLGSRALREITGQNFGVDGEAWRKWWDATHK